MNLPLVLAGPIVRRVEPGLVSVWLALSEEATQVMLTLFEGRATPGSLSLLSGPAPRARSVRVGDRLHLVLVTLSIPPDKTLQPGRVYSYNVTITTKSGKEATLQSEKLLGEADINGQKHLPLGYDPDVLPSFSLPPAELTQLRIVHGSCRRANSPQADGLVWVDDFIREARSDPATFAHKRPHQLLMSGDQIYADDVARLHISMLNDLGNLLIGTGAAGAPVEQLFVEHVRRKGEAAQTSEQIEKAKVAPAALPADQAHFPPGWRNGLIMDEARMTSTDGHSHLLSLGEFCAMYLSVWSAACWPPVGEFPKEDRFVQPITNFPDVRPAYLSDPFVEKGKEMSPEAKKKKTAELRRSYEEEKRILTEFLAGLPKVRRALANVPTYLMFDDHEVTDDWYLNPLWRDRVLTSELGKTVIRNGILSYALFQGWGNDPLKFASEKDYKRLLELTPKLFPGTAVPVPDKAAGDEIDHLLGLDLHSGRETSDPPLKWHYSVPGARHHLLAIDNRTRRSFLSDVGPPGNVSLKAQDEQIPPGPLPANVEVLLVIAPLQVIGPPTLDELIAPLSYRAIDIMENGKLQSHAGTKDMTGTNPDAIEAWAFDPLAFEGLIKRLAEKARPHRRVVFLSGDVHYGTSSVMSYWRKGDKEPARFAQFTSSGIKNVMPWYIRFIDRSLGFAQKVARAKLGAERLGWDANSPTPLQVPPGAKLAPALSAKLKRTPVMVPTLALPAGTTVTQNRQPDWSWRVDVVRDQRKDDERPAPARPDPLDAPGGDIKLDLAGYREIAKRHAGQLERLNNSRQILFQSSNIGLITFSRRTERINGKDEEIIDATQTLFTSSPKAADPKKGEPYTVHVVPLRAPSEPRPEEKLKPAAG